MQRQPIGPIILALAVAMAPLVHQLPGWTLAWCTLTWSYVLLRNRFEWPMPPRGVRLVVFLMGMAALLLFAGLRFDGGDFIALLAAMAGLKPLEIQRRRDSMVTLFLAYFLVITSLFVFENLSMTLYLFVSVWVTTGVLIRVNHPQGIFRRQMLLAGRLLLTAVPLMVFLFLFFPRLSGSFWGAPWAGQGRSGFSSTMRIGDVSRLVLVDEPAFTVRFDSAVPSMEQLYWRGIVFQRFDGRTWHPARNRKVRRSQIHGKALSRYTVILEPHGHRYLFALDRPVTATPKAIILQDHTLQARRPVRRRLHYAASSQMDFRPDTDDMPNADDLQLPPDRNPLSVAMGRQWAAELPSSAAMVDRALRFFRQNGFVYTLQPDRADRDVIDAFLFTSRRGFCEHFAAAFTVLMRAAGVPTRIVGGYQGGQWNALGKFFSVRHSDAHAWCEVWLNERGWVRVDPTSAVAPERIDEGIARALSGEGMPAFLMADRGDLVGRWVQTLRMTWDAFNVQWNMWFMGFSAEDQLALIRQLGVSARRAGKWAPIVVLPLLFVVGLALNRRLRKGGVKSPPDEALKIYRRFQKKMSRIGMSQAPHQGPLDFAGRVRGQHPLLQLQVDEIVAHYIALRYGPGADAQSLKRLRRLVRRFDPGAIRRTAVGGPRSEARSLKSEDRGGN